MKIALFTDTFFPQINGVVQMVHTLAESLSSRGHTVCVFTVSTKTPMSSEERPAMHYRVVTIPSIPIPMYRGQRLTAPIGLALSQVRAFDPDIIHMHTPLSMGQEAHLCAKRLSVPLVGTHHTFFDQYLKIWHLDYRWARYLSWKVTNLYYKHCAMVITPTEALAAAMQKHGLRVPIEVIPNAMPLSDAGFRPREGARAAAQKSVVYMGRLSPEKDVETVIDAFALLVAAREDARLVIIGDGPSKEKLEARAGDRGIAKQVTFTGFLRGEKLAQELRAHHVFVTASKSENMPLSVLEAMASGLPIIGVAALGMPEIVTDGENGILVPPGDTGALTAALRRVLLDDALRERFARASRVLALRHDPDAAAAQHEQVYTRLTQSPRVPKDIPSPAG